MKKEEQSKLIKIIKFPEKTNNIFLFFIVVLLFGIVIILDACVFFKKDYNYEPNYEEVKYTEWVNPYMRVFNNYTYEDGEITTKYRVIGCYYGEKSSNYVIDYKIDAIMITSGGEYIYKGDDAINTTSTNTKTDYLMNNEGVNSGIIEKIYYKFQYTRYENSYKGKDEVITIKEEILSLNKKELEMENCNEFLSVSDVISFYELTKKKDETKMTFVSNLKLNEKNDKDYHIDFQLFGVDVDDKIYNLIGYYNLGNNLGNLLNHETTVANQIPIKEVIIKCRIIDEEHGERVVFMKKSINDLSAA